MTNENSGAVAYQWVAQALVTVLIIVVSGLAWVAYDNLRSQITDAAIEFRKNNIKQEERYNEIIRQLENLSGKIHGNTSWIGRLDKSNRQIIEELNQMRERTLILEERGRKFSPRDNHNFEP